MQIHPEEIKFKASKINIFFKFVCVCVAKLSKFDLIYSQKFSYRNQVWALQCEIPQKTKPQPYVLSSLLSRLVRIVCLRALLPRHSISSIRMVGRSFACWTLPRWARLSRDKLFHKNNFIFDMPFKRWWFSRCHYPSSLFPPPSPLFLCTLANCVILHKNLLTYKKIVRQPIS